MGNLLKHTERGSPSEWQFLNTSDSIFQVKHMTYQSVIHKYSKSFTSTHCNYDSTESTNGWYIKVSVLSLSPSAQMQEDIDDYKESPLLSLQWGNNKNSSAIQ